MRGRVYTILEHAERWQASVDARLQIDRGPLEVVRFEIPPEWTGPFEIEPPSEHMVAPLPGRSRRRLVIRPKEPLTGAARLTIRGPLVAAATREQVPEVRPLDLPQVETMIVVPNQVRSRKIEWDTSFLQAAPTPQELQGERALDDATVYRVSSPRFRAAIRQVEQPQGEPAVLFAELGIRRGPGRDYSGVATFDLDPAGRRQCELALPDGCRLVHLFLDEQSPTVEPSEDGRWTVPLGPDHLVQRMEVVYAGSLPAAAPLDFAPGAASPPGPSIVDWPVRETIVTLADSQSPAAPGVGPAPAEWERNERRLTRLRELQERRGELVATHNADEIADWWAPWRRRSEVARRTVRQQSALESTAATIRSDEARAKTAGLLLETAPPDGESSDANTLVVSESIDLWRTTFAAPARVHVIEGAPDPTGDASSHAGDLQLGGSHASGGAVQHSGPRNSTIDWASLALAAAASLGLTVSLGVPSVRRNVEIIFQRRLPWLTAIAGLAWWFWLTPAWFGTLVVLAAMGAAVRRATKR